MKSKKKWWTELAPWTVAFAVIALWYSGVYSFMGDIRRAEPDVYYELSLARQTATDGIVRSIPQAEGLNWSKSYQNKNYLFTTIAGVAYKIGGEKAALAMVPILALIFLGCLLWLVAPYCGTPLNGFLVLAVLMSTAIMDNRLVTLRPHLLGMISFVLLLKAILTRRPYLAAAAGFIFTAGYHLVALPLALLGISALVYYRFEKRVHVVHLWGAGGLLAGFVVNPYFPFNLITETQTWQIALNSASISNVDRAQEMLPYSAEHLLKTYGLFLASIFLLFADWAGLVRKKTPKSQTNPAEVLVVLSTIFFFILSAFNSRALEYAVPLGAVTFAFLIARWKGWRLAPWVVGAMCVFLQLPPAFEFYGARPKPARDHQWLVQAIKAIPQAGHKKVFNCEWWTTPTLLYERPELSFVDISDPLLMSEANPPLFRMRETMKQGLMAYPFGPIRFAFQSDYVLCENPTVVSKLEYDPHFKRLFPTMRVVNEPAGFPYVYEVAEKPRPNLVFDYEISTNGEDWETISYPERKFLKPEQYSPYMDLNRILGRDAKVARAVAESDGCLWVRPAKESVKTFLGATWISVGGGPEIKMWLNGTRFFYQAGWEHQLPGMFNAFVPLPKALSAKDNLEASVCRKGGFDYQGFGLSFWKANEIQEICKQKGLREFSVDKELGRWTNWGETPHTCLGIVAGGQPQLSSLKE